jgi:anti-sigma28 factor (negative regulator of flagellin synthesis)
MMNPVQGLTIGCVDAVQTASRASSPRVSHEPSAPAADQTTLSGAAMAVLTDSPARIAQLKTAVDSGSYQPSPAAVATKLVAGALAH